jgi:hypothetical protein
MCNVTIYRTVQHHLLGACYVPSQFAEQYVDVETCGKFSNHIVPVITSFLFVSHLTVRQS